MAARVLLVGEPNVGKSTLFNTLTGARQRIVNAPGTTVELTSGLWRDTAGAPGRDLVDLPGTHSLLARSLDERVTADAVRAMAEADSGDGAVVVVADATLLERSLYLVAQVAETGVPFVVALTMVDRAARDGGAAPRDLAAALTGAIGVPVIPVDPRRRGDEALRDLAAAVDAAPALHPTRRAALPPLAPATEGDPAADLAHAESLFAWVEAASGNVRAALDAPHAAPPGRSPSDRLDAVLLNPWAGIPVFLAVVFALFELTTRFAAPLQDAIETIADRVVVSGLTSALSAAGLGGTRVEGLLVDGLLAGVVTVLTFLPVMGLMFLALGALEGSGYMARAALVADRAMRGLGLDGRALLPLIVGFGCNLPALAATRTLPHARQRLLTGLLVPLTSCSARLTVYVLLATTFFPDRAGLVIFAMYVASVTLVLAAGLALRRTWFRDLRSEPFMLVLPPYQWPHPRTLWMSAWVRVRAFVVGAGTVIVATMLAMWVLTAIPAPGAADGANPVDGSLYGALADGISPVLDPAGFGTRTASAALISGFVAKEVVVGSLAQSTAMDGADVSPGEFHAALRRTFDAGSGGHGGAAALAFMVFVLAYTPCVAALAEQRRMFGWRPTATALVAQLALAWLLAVAVFQAGVAL
ncbi:MAG: ferrous iron transporter B [Thermoleophilia bacterium]|nr:ferrous iron transporter B [Thermoleophilia bacterium]